MKKIIAALLACALLLLSALQPISSRAAETVPEGLKYSVANNAVTVTDYTGTATALQIPSEIQGYPVTAIGHTAFSYCQSLRSVTVPDSVTAMGENVFYNCEALISIRFLGRKFTQQLADPQSIPPYYEEHLHGGGWYTCAECNPMPRSALSYINPTVEILIPAQDATWDDDTQTLDALNWVRYTPEDQSVAGSEKGIVYETISGEIVITDYTGTAAELEIPPQIAGYPVVTVADGAFSNCITLTAVTVPDSVTAIGDSAFANCEALKSITLGANVAAIGQKAFYQCASLSAITIPDSVSAIGSYAFYGCRALTTADMGSGITAVSDYTFANCPELTGVILPDGVTAIGDYGFYDCRKLTGFAIPDQVVTIGDNAFTCCLALTEITLPDSVTAIGDYAFNSCNITRLVIGDGLVTIPEYAFGSCYYLTDVILGDHVATIDKYAFRNCHSLKHITFGSSITTIGTGAFYECTGLTELTVPDSVQSIGASAFRDCTGLQAVRLGDGVTAIGDYAFNRCIGMTDVTIGNNVTDIGKEAFANCSGLTSVTVPDSVVSLGNSAFQSCNKLESVDIGSNVTAISDAVFAGCTSLNSLEIPENVTAIGHQAFSDCTGLTGITIPDSVQSIGCRAFYDCDSLKTVTVGKGVTIIDKEAFRNCAGLTAITLPDSVTTVGDSAFQGCSGLGSATVGDSVTSIGYSAFDHCTSLTSITIPDSIVSLGGSAFKACNKLESADIGSNVTALGYGTFQGCASLTHITIPDSVQSLGSYVFDGCASLKTVTVGKGVTTIGQKAFYNCSSLTGITLPDSVITVGSSAFEGCTGLETVTIGNGVTEIEDKAFFGCAGLSTCVIGNSISEIGCEAFSGCAGLTDITLPASLTVLGEKAFYKCSKLESIRFLGESFTNRYIIYDILPEDCFGVCINPDGEYYCENCNPQSRSALSHINPTVEIYIPAGDASWDPYVEELDFLIWVRYDPDTQPPAETEQGIVYEIVNGEVMITDYTGAAADLVIPSEIGGYPVTAIEGLAFSGCDSLISITVPDSITAIGDGAFFGCSRLRHVAYTGAQAQWQSISIGEDNTCLSAATRHYETRFEAVDNCVEDGVYCPVCQEFIIHREKEGGAHSYGQWVVITPATMTEEGSREQICAVCGAVNAEALPVLCGKVDTWGISLTGDISVNFNLVVNEDATDDMTVTVVADDVRTAYSLSELPIQEGRYLISVNLAAAQMNDPVIIILDGGNGAPQEMSYTVRQYAEYILTGSYGKSVKDLVKAMLNYGAAAQDYFDHNTDTPANQGYEQEELPNVPEASPQSSYSGSVDGVVYYGASLLCENKIGVRLYFDVTGNVEDYIFRDSRGQEYPLQSRNGLYYLEIKNINPDRYDEVIEITVTDGESALTVQYSPLRYISRRFYCSEDQKLVKMVAQLYAYHLSAKAYVSESN